MYRVPLESLRPSSNVPRPSGAAINCPLCGARVTFNIQARGWTKATNHLSWACADCPDCGGRATFIAISSPDTNIEQSRSEVYVHPALQRTREPLSGLEELDLFRGQLGRAYVSAVGAYNAADWNATASHCGRVLEGITKTVLPEAERGALGKMIGALPKHLDLDAPILHRADTIREGRNIAAHFDLERETDAEMATLLLDLLESLIAYLFLLPERIEEARDKLAATR
ncbi:MAG: hypothetical protein ACREK5_04885 [Gemmatimonadota bacterium]